MGFKGSRNGELSGFHDIRPVGRKKCIGQELLKNFVICDAEKFEEKLSAGKNILIIADNAGEAVFDRVLIESLKDKKATYAVQAEPIINDITMEKAKLAGIDQCTRIISTGCNTPSIIFEECSKEFLETYEQADIVLSKGQGNYAPPADEGRDVFILLKAKCSIIAEALGVGYNDYVFKYKKQVKL